MPILKNPRQELFAQELAMGETADAAYITSGYKENHGNAGRLKANETVRARVREILAVAAHRANVTIESIGAELEEARRLAVRLEMPSPAVAAAMGKARLYGHLIERVELGGHVQVANDELWGKMTREERASMREMLETAKARQIAANQNEDAPTGGVVPALPAK